MSHVTHVTVSITDLDALERAAEKCGLELIRDSNEYRWYGRVLDLSAIPEGYTEEDMGRCEHELRVIGNGNAYSAGLVSRRDGEAGWALHYDNWSKSGKVLEEFLGKDCHNVVQAYAVEVAKASALNAGYSVIGESVVDGKVELLLSM